MTYDLCLVFCAKMTCKTILIHVLANNELWNVTSSENK